MRHLSSEKFQFIKNKYKFWFSWAVWADKGDTPKSNIGDLSVLDPKRNSNLLSILNPNFVLVALNISRGDIKIPFASFQYARPEATDFKIRYTIKNTPLWGAYMTDIIKVFNEKISGKVAKYLKENKNLRTKIQISFSKSYLTLAHKILYLLPLGMRVLIF